MSKRASNGQGHIRQRPNGLWEGIYTVWVNGEKKQKSIYGKTSAEVREKLTAITRDIDTGEFVNPDKITLAEWAEFWQENFLNGIKKTTLTQYSDLLRLHILPALGHMRLQAITTPMIQKFYNSLLKKLSAKSIKNVHGVLRQCLDKAVVCGYLRHNPADACSLPKAAKHEMHVIESENIPMFLQAIRGSEYENLYFVALTTGMRQAEIIGLTWDCVDFSRGMIRVEKQLRKNHGRAGETYEFTSPKNGKIRILKPAPMVFDALKREKRKQAENALKFAPIYENKDNLVFTNEIGEHLCSVTVYSRLKRVLKGIGLEEVRFHDLRHTYATLSIENGDDLKTVSGNLGHATVAFTADVYAHVTDRMKENSADRMQAFLTGVIAK